MREREARTRTPVRLWTLGGALIGTTCGMLMYVASVFGSEHTWGGMTLLSVVLSAPAGLWVFNLMGPPVKWGIDLGLTALVVGPAVNGAVVGAFVGCLLWFGER